MDSLGPPEFVIADDRSPLPSEHEDPRRRRFVVPRMLRRIEPPLALGAAGFVIVALVEPGVAPLTGFTAFGLAFWGARRLRRALLRRNLELDLHRAGAFLGQPPAEFIAALLVDPVACLARYRHPQSRLLRVALRESPFRTKADLVKLARALTRPLPLLDRRLSGVLMVGAALMLRWTLPAVIVGL